MHDTSVQDMTHRINEQWLHTSVSSLPIVLEVKDNRKKKGSSRLITCLGENRASLWTKAG